MNNKVIITGAGPAGIACAIQLKRYGITPVVFEKNKPGGLLRNANLVENYPGFPGGIKGVELVEKLTEHLAGYNLCPVSEEVKRISLNNDGLFCVKTQNAAYSANFLVIASGTKPGKFNTEASNVFYEVCELYKHDTRGKKIVIIGSGDAAFDYALNIAGNSRAAGVTILNRGSKTKCIPLLKQRVLKNKNINYIENRELDEGIEYDYILCATGREPDDGFLDNTLENSEKVFFAGDVKNGDFRQAAIAAGDGIRAAMGIYANLYKQDIIM